MPYYIYKIKTTADSASKKLEPLSEHENFKAAKQEVREMRAASQDDNVSYKVIFAGNFYGEVAN